MLQTVKISSKRQITIPAKVYDALNLSEGDRLIVELHENKIVLQKAQTLLDEVAGSVELPERYRGKSMEFIIRDAKSEYFKRKK